jgi:hypothetical protein
VTVEASFNYPSDLNASYPAAGDARSEGDDHIRGIKSVLKTTLPNVSGAVTPTHTELNYVDGVTSAIQTQLDAKAAITSFASSLAGSGYQKLQGGLIIQWGGGFIASSAGITTSFPIAFPTGFLVGIICHYGNAPAVVGEMALIATSTQITGYSEGAGPYNAAYIAIGY